MAKEGAGRFTVMIDDVSLLEVAANGSADDVLDFLHYCVTLTSEMVKLARSIRRCQYSFLREIFTSFTPCFLVLPELLTRGPCS
jgi:hypothetical protein